MVGRRKTQFFTPIREVFAIENNYTGEVGIEIEVEGRQLPGQPASYWQLAQDGSLRGESGEYVLIKPAARDNVAKYLNYLDKQFKKHETKLNMSPRTSVHVHINMNKQTLVDCYTYIILYLIFEDLLVDYAGPNRVGNLFCLRARDAEMLIDELTKYVRTKNWAPDPAQLRYTSVNICAIQKFNSVEFRALRGTMDQDVINEWVEILLALKDAALTYHNPQEIMQDFSLLGPSEFIRKILPNHWRKFTRKDGWENIIWESLRLVQEIAYASNWEQPANQTLGRLFPVEDEDRQPVWEEE